jgi:hypothetical protein
MYTSIGAVTLAGLFLASAPAAEVPVWQHSYDLARQQGKREGKPLAVILGSGKQGFQEVAEEGKLSRRTRKLLAAHYIPVYLDLKARAGRQLAKALDISEGVGIVISDRTGRLQAFSHDGTLSNEDLAYYLERYADPDHIVRTTEGTESLQVSLDAPQANPAPQPAFRQYIPAAPVIPASFGGFGGFGGGFGGGGRC